MLVKFIASSLKIMAASLIVGAVLSLMHVSMADILARFGLTPADLAAALVHMVEWALPNIVLGAVFVIPSWIMLHLFRPPKGYE